MKHGADKMKANIHEDKDNRIDFIQDFTLRSLRLKPDKWLRMVVSDEQRGFIQNFVDGEWPQVRWESACFFSSSFDA